MKKSVVVLAIIAGLAVVGLFGYEVYKYSQEPKPAPSTVSVEKYNEVVNYMKEHDAVNAANLEMANAKIEAITAKRDKLCATYKNVRIAVDPALCQ